jgi:hypothetical protein
LKLERKVRWDTTTNRQISFSDRSSLFGAAIVFENSDQDYANRQKRNHKNVKKRG